MDGEAKTPPITKGDRGRIPMGPRGLEPPTSPLSGVRSSQLSYEPGFLIAQDGTV